MEVGTRSRWFIRQTGTHLGSIFINHREQTTSRDEARHHGYSETLRYIYLPLDRPSLVSLDEHVPRTKGHLFKSPTDDIRRDCEMVAALTNPRQANCVDEIARTSR